MCPQQSRDTSKVPWTISAALAATLLVVFYYERKADEEQRVSEIKASMHATTQGELEQLRRSYKDQLDAHMKLIQADSQRFDPLHGDFQPSMVFKESEKLRAEEEPIVLPPLPAPAIPESIESPPPLPRPPLPPPEYLGRGRIPYMSV